MVHTTSGTQAFTPRTRVSIVTTETTTTVMDAQALA